GNKTGRVYIPIQFDAGNSFDQDNDEMFYYWEFGDGENATGIKISHTYKKSGVYNLTLIVSDGNLNGIDNATITIENKEPKPKINILTPAENGTHPIKDDIIFDGSESTDEYTIGLNYTWKFGDGGEAKGSRVNHSYKKGGEYSVVLYAIDTEGLMNYTSRNIRVNNPPVCKIVSPKNNAKYTTRDLIHFIGEGNDEDGDVLRYEWLIDDQLFHVEQSFNDTIIADGWHTVKLVVYDGYALPKDYWDNTEMIIINIIPHPNIKPDLFNGSVTPSSGIEDTLFNFTVKYIDEDDDKPSYMHVVIDGISFDMFEVDTNDTTYKDGKLYYYTMKLSGASYHTYHFKTIDKRGETNVTQPQKGPKVLRVSTIIHENIYIVATYAGPGTISVSKIGKPKDISNPKDTLDIGLFYNITSKGIELEDIDIIEIRISYKDLNVSKVNVSTLKIYHLTDAGWELVPLTGVDTSGSVVWAKVRSLTIFGVFGSKAPGVPTNGKDHGPPIEKGYLVWIAGAVIVIVIFLSVFVLAWKREAKKKEERIEIRIEGEVAEEVVKEKKILPTEAVSVTIEEAKVFKPIEEKEKKAIEEKKILPTEAVSVTIEEAKIFRPGKAIEEKEEVEEKKEVDLLKEMEEILELTKKKEEKKVEKKKDEDIFDDILKDIEEMKKK
ncbi:MAG: PKD domain-containing protein, partial [Candidatus Thermoplasmatota archaeon]